MDERTFRASAIVLLAIFVTGSLYFDFVTSQNGRYAQYDRRGEYSPDGASHVTMPAYQIFDTRTGKVFSE